MKISLPQPKPRNPWVALARARRAGSHRPGSASQRRQAHRDMQRELAQLKPSP